MAKLAYKLSGVLLLTLAASASWAAQRSFDKRFEVSAGGHLAVDTMIGSIAVVGQDSHEVDVHAEIVGSRGFVDDFTVTADRQSSDITVRGYGHCTWMAWRCGGWWDWLFPMERVRFVISVPRDYRVDVRTAGGGIDVRNVNASVTGRTAGGGIVVRDITGSIDMRTSGGGIYLEDCTGDVDVHTSGGGIHLDGIDGRIVAATSGGGIHAEARSNHGISLRTGGGGITLLLPADVRALVDAWTLGGRVRVDFPLTSAEAVSPSHVHGAINGGGEQVILHTAGGGIHVGPS